MFEEEKIVVGFRQLCLLSEILRQPYKIVAVAIIRTAKAG